MSYSTIKYELNDHVAVLTYDRPEQRNAVSRRMNAELHDAWQRFRDDDDAFVLVITGEGDAFCAGWDLADAAATTVDDWDEFRTRIHNSPGECGYTRRVDVFKPVIAAVNGWAVAAGLVVGYGRAMEMIVTGRPVGADEALRIGLANEVVPKGKALERALELAGEIAALPQGAIRSDKETMVRNVGRTYEEQLRTEAEMTLSMFMRRDSHAIGARAFKERRPPEWPHRGL
jgi:enoyl-CoA hydratase